MATGMTATRREVVRSTIQSLVDVPTIWALRSEPMMDPIGKAKITLRTESVNDKGWQNKIRDSACLTTIAQSRRLSLEVKIASLSPDREANEIGLTLLQRINRGPANARLKIYGLAAVGSTPLIELDAQVVDTFAVSVCVFSLLFNMADTDDIVDGFNTWIDTADIAGGPTL